MVSSSATGCRPRTSPSGRTSSAEGSERSSQKNSSRSRSSVRRARSTVSSPSMCRASLPSAVASGFVTLPVGAYRLEGISPRAYQHPADRAAAAALHAVPYLDQVVRKLIELGYERALRAVSLGSSVRLGQEQLPHIWVLHRQVFNALDLADVPDLYLTQWPFANAMTIGSGRPIVVLNSELVTLLDGDGQRAVLAHEAAHVHSDHVLYQTALVILLQIGTQNLPMFAGLPLLAIRYALLEWFRAAELSCDRAAALLTRDPQAMCRALMVLSAGAAAEHLNLDAFIKQGIEYSETG